LLSAIEFAHPHTLETGDTIEVTTTVAGNVSVIEVTACGVHKLGSG
jgi:hypothetical protein